MDSTWTFHRYSHVLRCRAHAEIHSQDTGSHAGGKRSFPHSLIITLSFMTLLILINILISNRASPPLCKAKSHGCLTGLQARSEAQRGPHIMQTLECSLPASPHVICNQWNTMMKNSIKISRSQKSKHIRCIPFLRIRLVGKKILIILLNFPGSCQRRTRAAGNNCFFNNSPQLRVNVAVIRVLSGISSGRPWTQPRYRSVLLPLPVKVSPSFICDTSLLSAFREIIIRRAKWARVKVREPQRCPPAQ